MTERRSMIDKGCAKLSVSKQCKLFDVSRSSLYYKSISTSSLNLELMRKMDEHSLTHPYKGAKLCTSG